MTDNELLTFEDKYIGQGGKGGKNGAKNAGPKTGGVINTGGFKIPAEIDKDIEEQIYQYSKEAFCRTRRVTETETAPNKSESETRLLLSPAATVSSR